MDTDSAIILFQELTYGNIYSHDTIYLSNLFLYNLLQEQNG